MFACSASSLTSKWVGEGEFVRLLGYPFWEKGKYGVSQWWEALMNNTLAKMASWEAHHLCSQIGKNMLANSMVWSRFRFPAQALFPPEYITSFLEDLTQSLIWSKDVEFSDEGLSASAFRRFMVNMNQYEPTNSANVGLGVLDWNSHLEALQLKWILRYLDPSQAPWKEVLDVWLARTYLGRQAVFSTIPVKQLTGSATQGRQGMLPKFWRKAIAVARKYPLVPMDPRRPYNEHDALSQPLVRNPSYSFPRPELWEQARLFRIADAFLKGLRNPIRPADIAQVLSERLPRTRTGLIVYKSGDKQLLAAPRHIEQWWRAGLAKLASALMIAGGLDTWHEYNINVLNMLQRCFGHLSCGKPERGILTLPTRKVTQADPYLGLGHSGKPSPEERQPGQPVWFVPMTGHAANVMEVSVKKT